MELRYDEVLPALMAGWNSTSGNSTDMPHTSRGADFSPEQTELLNIAVSITSALSIIGAGFVIISYCLLGQYRYFHLRLTLYLAIADFIMSTLMLINANFFYFVYIRTYKFDFWCKAIAFAMQYSVGLSLLWTTLIAYTLQQVIVRRNYDVDQYERYYHLIAWTLPILTLIVPTLKDGWGGAGLWCWIDLVVLRIFDFYIPLTIVMATNMLLLAQTLWVRRRKKSQPPAQSYGAINSSASVPRKADLSQQSPRGYPAADMANTQQLIDVNVIFTGIVAVLFICWMPGMVHRVVQVFTHSEIFSLSLIQAICTPLQGALNSLILGWNDAFRKRLFSFIRGGCCCGKGREHSDGGSSRSEGGRIPAVDHDQIQKDPLLHHIYVEYDNDEDPGWTPRV
eukprot:TRINITY_DN15497_c0_g1_i1.p1 TRINITY_DN15497_c0_g1~~TRINITY_DN15497_c0_g1_i1.p1  ORF type:complete len:395 (+),score=40.26 TRINITY_DN15497_c0_g1_i1:136-1320(+)